MKRWKKWAVGLLAAVLVIALPIGAFRVWSSPGWATLLVTLQREKFDAAADAVLAGEEPALPFGAGGARRTGGLVSFDLGAWGIGSATSYWGVYRSPSPAAVPIIGDVSLSPGGNGWSWQEEPGDNSYRTEAIADGWWYWRAWF